MRSLRDVLKMMWIASNKVRMCTWSSLYNRGPSRGSSLSTRHSILCLQTCNKMLRVSAALRDNRNSDKHCKLWESDQWLATASIRVQYACNGGFLTSLYGWQMANRSRQARLHVLGRWQEMNQQIKLMEKPAGSRWLSHSNDVLIG